MPATIVRRSDTAFTIQIEIPYGSSMLEADETIPEHLNQAGTLAPAEMVPRFDTDGSPIPIADTKLTSMGRVLKEYQTPYGVAPVERHIYQGGRGGKTYCPLDRNARIVGGSTPRFATMVSHRYAEFGSSRVIEDLRENHGRTVARSFVQNVADAGAAVAGAPQQDWEYARPELEGPVATITIGIDGTGLLMRQDGLAGDAGRHHRLLRPAGRAAAHHRSGGDTRVRPGDGPRPPGAGDRPGQGGLPAGPLRGVGRRGQGELGFPGATH